MGELWENWGQVLHHSTQPILSVGELGSGLASFHPTNSQHLKTSRLCEPGGALGLNR